MRFQKLYHHVSQGPAFDGRYAVLEALKASHELEARVVTQERQILQLARSLETLALTTADFSLTAARQTDGIVTAIRDWLLSNGDFLSGSNATRGELRGLAIAVADAVRGKEENPEPDNRFCPECKSMQPMFANDTIDGMFDCTGCGNVVTSLAVDSTAPLSDEPPSAL